MVQLWRDVGVNESPNPQEVVRLYLTLTQLNVRVDVLLGVKKYVDADEIIVMTKLLVFDVFLLSDFENQSIVLTRKCNLELVRERKLFLSAPSMGLLRSPPIKQ